MRRGLVLPFALVLSLALAAGLTDFYDRLEAALGQVRLENPAQAVNALSRAQSLLREEGALPPVLRDAALTNLQEARQFLAQKSAVDLEARLLLVRHLVGKALYDAFLQAQGEERAALGQRLAQATGLPPALVAQARAAPPEEARRLLEARYLQAMAEDLGQALAAQNRPQAYLALARAYARYLIVQDSPQSRLRAQDFVQALALVSSGQPFRPEVQRLLGQVQAWRQSLLSLQTDQAPSPTEAAPPPAPASQPQASPPRPGSVGALLAGELPEGLEEELSFLALEPEAKARLGEALQALGYGSVLDWLAIADEVRGALALAQLYAQSGHFAQARAQLDYAHSRFRLKLLPVAEAYAPGVAKRTDLLFQRLRDAVGLRALDISVLLGELQELEERLLGNTLGPWHALQVQAELLLLGIPRSVFFILAAVLSFFPLYLIRITFGGRNVYWNLLGLGFFFLFLPILAEGLSYMGSILAEYGGLPALGALANLSVAQSLLAYWGWGLSVFLVVALAGAGLRGIAAQFGLLREREPEASRRDTAPTLTSETIVEWDEEF
ncbi:hypothetical protein Ththe16_1921 [Thermus thermophilus SG0.5JP17-16]|uniref:Uncharacterized protein n=1 Tax=Thermus thermophilus (strain SG0.5JP17-16) TaxID=762633 RepID=F6DFX6_THETG|nr:hypothetical protein [Thermus thermophilus]AEG34313.1 hypothetical protein Ththe16_1921 [Thermus thermophilus SG0.5JP17-16]